MVRGASGRNFVRAAISPRGGAVGIGIRHIGRAALMAGGAMATTLAAQVVVARNHRFLPSDPMFEINCALGPEDGKLLVLAVLGDSSVAGVGADRPEDTLTYGVARALAEIDPDVVLVCVGTNDITHCTPVHEVWRQLQLLGAGLVTAAPRAVAVVSGLPPAETSLAFRWPLRQVLGVWARAYTRLFQAELSRHGITVVDVAAVARDVFRRNREMFSPDLFHPSSTGYTFLGQFYGQAVRRAVDAARAAELAALRDLASDLAG